MRTSRLLLAAALLVGAAACSDDDKTAVTTTAPPETSAPADDGSADGGTVIVSETTAGEVLTDAAGMTLYIFTPDTATTSACSGGCATTWPPFTDAVVAGAGLDAAQFGSITRDDGATQATYFGHPLYYFAGDAKPGDANGHGSGGSWFAITAEGEQPAG